MIIRFYPYLGLPIILAIFWALAFSFSTTIPFGEAPDEWDHFQYSQFIATHHHLPTNLIEREEAGRRSDWPPLYHTLTGYLTSWVDVTPPPDFKFRWTAPEHRLADTLAADFVIIPTADQEFPYRGVMLAWQLRRWLSILLSTGTVIVSFFIMRQLFPTDPFLALSGTAMVAFIPQFLLISSALNDDNLVGLLTALFLLLLILGIRGTNRLWLYAGLGALAGLVITAKYSAGLLPLELVVVLWLIAGLRDWKRRQRLTALIVSGAALLLAAGWWFLFVEWHFNEVKELGLWPGLVKPLLAGGPEDVTTIRVASFLTGGAIPGADLPSGPTGNVFQWVGRFYLTFWGVEKGGTLLDFLNLGAGLILLVLMIAAGVMLWRRWPNTVLQNRVLLMTLALQIIIFIPFPLLRFMLTHRLSDTAQGRHLLFPAAVTMVGLLLWGLGSRLRPRQRRWLGLGLAVGMLAWAIVSLTSLQAAYGDPLPVRTSPEAVDSVSHPLNQNFGDVLKLVGYDLQTCSNSSALELNLVWKRLGKMKQDYQTEISLLDNEGQVWAQWLGHPAQGRYPTRAWEKGEIVSDTIWIPLTNVPDGTYEVQIRLVGWEGSLQVDGADTFGLTTISKNCQVGAASRTLPLLAGNETFVAQYDLWQNGQIMPGSPTYRYRATIPITVFQTEQSASQADIRLSLVGPDERIWTPERVINNLFIFVVGPEWLSGDYTLRTELWRNDVVVAAADTKPVLTVENVPRLFELPPMQHAVRANFADRVMLLGYDLPTRRVDPGNSLSITLYWQGLRLMGENFRVFNRLLDSEQQIWGSEDRLPRETYGTVLWVPNEVVVDSYEISVAEDAPHGIYSLDVGLYLPLNQDILSLPIVEDNRPIDANSVRIGPIKVGGPPPGITVARASPANSVSVDLGQVISLVGYDLALEAGTVTVTLYWQSNARIYIDYTLFVHLLNQAGDVVAQLDRPPASGAYPTSLWEPGDIIPDEISVPLPDNLPAGQYLVVVGLYDFETGTRLTIPEAENNSIELTAIEIR